MAETSLDCKQCEQCKETKSVTCFRKVGNMYTGIHYMSICKDCYSHNQKEDRRRWEEQQKQHEAEQAAKEETERIAREQEQQRLQLRALELSIQANKLCPRCHQIQTNGDLWIRENGEEHFFFPRYCQSCTNATMHSIYILICPILNQVRYVGITCQRLEKRLAGHMRNEGGIEQKLAWIDTLRGQRLTARIEKIDEAPNEKQAKQAEQQWIDHYLRLGCPLTNSEVLTAQRVLDRQSGRISQNEDWGYKQSLFLSAQQFRWECRDNRRLSILRWHNRSEHVYFLDTTYNRWIPSHHFTRKAQEYDHVTFAHDLAQIRAERQAALSTVTLAFMYWDITERFAGLTQTMHEDIRYLWDNHIPIICEKVERDGIIKGFVIGITQKNIPVLHPFSYSIDSARALIAIVSENAVETILSEKVE